MESREAEQRWYNFPSMYHEPSPRSGHKLAMINGRVLVIGGVVRRRESLEMRTLVHVLDTDLISFSEKGEGPQFISRDEWSGSTRIGNASEREITIGEDLSKVTLSGEELVFEGIRNDTDNTRLNEWVTATDDLESGAPKARSKKEDSSVGQDISSSATPDTITRTMSATEILQYLVGHGCRDVSKDLDILKISDYPMSFGGFGDVYCATLQNGDRIGIKCVRVLTNSSSDGKKLLRNAAHELYVWSKCKHPNVIELLGVMLFRDQIAMVSPWLENGHLRYFLSHMSQVDRCALCVQIADGVAYLHQQSIVSSLRSRRPETSERLGDRSTCTKYQPVLSQENILISKDHNPKLTDFGNSALAEYTLQFTHSSTVQGMSLRWAAPEIIQEESKPTQASDVYALGMEVISREMPYAGAKDSAIVFKVVAGTKPTRPKTHIPAEIEQADRLWSMLIDCWASDPQERPKASEVRDMMKTITPRGLLSNVDALE
ncbi:unnamed protein product [Rhizoctonia solani]|uniref:Protein kinase domain-containing protein n=1 Tax=Rhizoctonia solani TaxID=456999 RepID=A0A8H3AU89_9AGAM|nr:unnamed protein product [Rhizoctonia solani]